MMHSFGLGAGSLHAPEGGIHSIEEFDKFAKAVATTGSATNDILNRAGIGTFQPESVEASFAKTITSNDEFKLYKRLKRTPVTQNYVIWKIQEGIGGQPGSSFNRETNKIRFRLGRERRAMIALKPMFEGVNTTVFTEWTDTDPDYNATQDANAMLRIGETANFSGYYGSEANSYNSFDGFRRQLELYAPSNVVNWDGRSDPNEVVKQVFDFDAKVRQQGTFGKITDLHLDSFVQNDLDALLFPQFRVNLQNNKADLDYGAPVGRIKTSRGLIGIEQDVYLRNYDNTKPFVVTNGSVLEDAPLPPTFVPTAVAPSVVGSKVTAARAGAYSFKVAAVNEQGEEGNLSAAAIATVAANGAIDFAITPHVSGLGNSFNIYVAPKGDAGTDNNQYRLLKTVAHPTYLTTPGAVVAYRFLFEVIAGTSDIVVGRFEPEAIDMVQLGPIMKLKLAAADTATVPRAIIAFMSLRLRIPKQHYWIYGYQPASATWKMF